MDIARPQLRVQKRRRQLLIATIVVLVFAAAAVGVSRLRRGSPTVERGPAWMDTVTRGSLLR